MSGKRLWKKNVFLCLLILVVITSIYIYNFSTIKKSNFSSSYKSINVVLEDNYPPYSFRSSNGVVQGVSVDQWRLFERKTGIKVNLVAVDWDSAQKGIKNGKFDVIDSIFMSEERNLIYDYTDAYADIDTSIFFNKNISGITDINSLNGFTTAVEKGDYSQEYLKSYGITNIVEYSTYEDIIKDAALGKINIFVMDKPPALYYLYKYNIINNFKYTEPLYSNKFHRAVLRGNNELLTTVNNGFKLISKKEYMDIDRKWFGLSSVYLKYSAYILFLAVGTILVIGILIFTANYLWINIKKKNKEIRNTEKSFTELFNSLKIGVAVFSKDRKLILSNSICREMFGISEETLAKESRLQDVLKYVVNADGSKIEYSELNVNKTFETKQPVKDFTLGIKQSGSEELIWAKGECTPRFNDSGEVESVLLTLVNITKMIKDSELLKSSENKNRAIIKAIPDLIFVVNTEGLFLEFLSDQKYLIQFMPGKYFINKSIKEMFTENTAALIHSAMERVISTGELELIEYPVYMNCEMTYNEARLVPFEEDRILLLIRDITERKKAEKRIYDMSMRDITTGLYNRNYFERKLTELKEQNVQDVGIIICDIDGLKLINDTMGHTEGDNLIKNAAYILEKCCSNNDITARIGGDEFAVIILNTSEKQLDSYKKKIIESAAELNVLNPVIPVSMSVGYSFTSSSEDLMKSFKEADTYMYREKLHHHQSKRSKNIDLLAKMLEARDFITEGHGERMQDLCVKLSKAINMTDSVIKDMILFAQFHDIGKVGIPDSILFKPGKLEETEYESMMRHTEIGYRIAESSPDIIHISDWILKHHERWDGNGYPYGLKRSEIPIQCRILAIVDAFDAMTNDRPYRSALSFEAAICEIKKCSGSQFDPDLVEKFINILQQEKINGI
ncbi:MAG: HD domain-containing phosphohydrolase [Solirubrobacterales bacterium]